MDLENVISNIVEFEDENDPDVVITISIRGLDINKPKLVIDKLVSGQVRETFQIVNKEQCNWIFNILTEVSNAIFTNK